ncbi:MAG: GNAT family N-acetyltransferase [Fimbriimonadaceae bacterium]|nr:GNAT family N-acetyltransferase [Fimbriimonadaceae bacterium]
MGDLLEHDTLTRFQAAARASLSHTYLELARTVAGVVSLDEPEIKIVTGPEDLAFCNFAVLVDVDDREFDPLLERLTEIARHRPQFSLFHLSGDRPADLPERLEARGWVRRYSIASLGWEGDAPSAVDLEPVEASDWTSRHETAAFMTGVFMSGPQTALARSVQHATERCPHRLLHHSVGGRILGAVMLAETPDSVGLFNLCVDDRHRERGIGGAILKWCMADAARRGKPLCLQCGEDLVDWYSGKGFQRIGLAEAWRPGTAVQ